MLDHIGLQVQDVEKSLDFYLGTGNPDLRSVIPNRMFRSVHGERFEEVVVAEAVDAVTVDRELGARAGGPCGGWH